MINLRRQLEARLAMKKKCDGSETRPRTPLIPAHEHLFQARICLPGDRGDLKARYIKAAVNGIICPTAIRSPEQNSITSLLGSSAY